MTTTEDAVATLEANVKAMAINYSAEVLEALAGLIRTNVEAAPGVAQVVLGPGTSYALEVIDMAAAEQRKRAESETS